MCGDVMDIVDTKRVAVFVDAQNLYHSIKEAFGTTNLRYNEIALAHKLCENIRQHEIHILRVTDQNTLWKIVSINFYMAMPNETYDPELHRFWQGKKKYLGDYHVKVREVDITYIPISGTRSFERKARGIREMLTADLLRFTLEGTFDVALIFSRSRSLQPTAEQMKSILENQHRQAKIYSVYPMSGNVTDPHGIPSTDWFQFNQDVYDACKHLDCDASKTL